ncbi:hypothetical protein D9Y22_18890 [Methylorubrum sp. DB1722]|nr:hypothetical protein [Methylorubrum sp. DB1722]
MPAQHARSPLAAFPLVVRSIGIRRIRSLAPIAGSVRFGALPEGLSRSIHFVTGPGAPRRRFS